MEELRRAMLGVVVFENCKKQLFRRIYLINLIDVYKDGVMLIIFHQLPDFLEF